MFQSENCCDKANNVIFRYCYILSAPYTYLTALDRTSHLDALTVSETHQEPPSDEAGINSPKSLAQEAVYVNQNFRQQVLRRVGFRFDNQIMIQQYVL